MKKLLVVATIAMISIAAQSGQDSSKTEPYDLLCKEAVALYPKAVESVKWCKENIDLEDDAYSYYLSFASCGTGEWVTLEMKVESGEILSGSSGLENDMCE